MSPKTENPDLESRFLGRLEPHRAILYKVARTYGRSPADRDDIVQEIVVQLWHAFPRYDEAFRFSTWMYRIALNVAISWHRREQTRTRHVLPAGDELLSRLAAANEGGDSDDLALLYRCIAGYDDLSKALLMLYLDGQNHQEIAAVLGITTTNVATRIGRLKDRLREDFRAAGHL